LEFINIVVEQLGNEINVCQNHSSAAISVEPELVECDRLRTSGHGLIGILVGVSMSLVLLNLLNKVNELVVLVANNLNQIRNNKRNLLCRM
jgi:hypothetical protein